MSSACENHHWSVAEWPRLGKNRLKLLLKPSPALLLRLREGNSLYSKIVIVIQL